MLDLSSGPLVGPPCESDYEAARETIRAAVERAQRTGLAQRVVQGPTGLYYVYAEDEALPRWGKLLTTARPRHPGMRTKEPLWSGTAS